MGILYCEACEASYNEGTKCDCHSYLVANWGDDVASPFQYPMLRGRSVKLQAESFAAAVEAYLSDTNCWERGRDIEVMCLKMIGGARISHRFVVIGEEPFDIKPVDVDYYVGEILPELYA